MDLDSSGYSHDTRPKKQFSQNFLQDAGVIDHIVHIIRPSEKDNLLEIGPGLGALTFPVLAIAKRLTAIEFDSAIIPRLIEKSRNMGDLKVIDQDVLKVDFSELVLAGEKLRVFGNLPYHISSPVIFHALEYLPIIQDLIFMLQLEVVERICATPGHKAYGRLTVMVQHECHARSCLTVPPTAFFPPPKVHSAIVQLVPHQNPRAKNPECFSKVVLEAFNQRRKTIANALKKRVSHAQLEAAGIDPTLRPEAINVAQYVALSDLLSDV